ncbi:MAG: hypothetical protein J5956_14480 [Ruminococcus sp.]|nr:hypothetical protein [Ruminococcus sp.]
MEHITITQASEHWKLSAKTIMNYVLEGVIGNLKVDNNILLLPKIRKPHYIGKNKLDVNKEIIRATGKEEYIDSLLVHKEEKTFQEIIRQLIECKYLIDVNNNDNYSTNKGLSLGIEGEKVLKKPRTPININFNFSLI